MDLFMKEKDRDIDFSIYSYLYYKTYGSLVKLEVCRSGRHYYIGVYGCVRDSANFYSSENEARAALTSYSWIQRNIL